jgi:hypothetical protein
VVVDFNLALVAGKLGQYAFTAGGVDRLNGAFGISAHGVRVLRRGGYRIGNLGRAHLPAIIKAILR